MNAPAATAQPAAVKESFWKRRVVSPIVAQLRQGITPEKIALTIALGGVLSIFPILGATTILCAAAAFTFRLNQPVIQLVNYLGYPAHLALLIPFYRAGESLFGHSHVPLSISFLIGRFRADPGQFMRDFGMIGVQGILVWALVSPALGTALYFGARGPLRAASRAFESARHA